MTTTHGNEICNDRCRESNLHGSNFTSEISLKYVTSIGP